MSIFIPTFEICVNHIISKCCGGRRFKAMRNNSNLLIQTSLTQIADDCWNEIIKYLEIKSMNKLKLTCKYCANITNPNNSLMNKYWQLQCYYLCKNIELNFQTKEWILVYLDLKKFFNRSVFNLNCGLSMNHRNN